MLRLNNLQVIKLKLTWAWKASVESPRGNLLTTPTNMNSNISIQHQVYTRDKIFDFFPSAYYRLISRSVMHTCNEYSSPDTRLFYVFSYTIIMWEVHWLIGCFVFCVLCFVFCVLCFVFCVY